MKPDEFIPANYSERFVRFFGWWSRDKMLAKRFFSVRLARGSAEALESLDDHAGPVIGAMNHLSWWDPIVMLNLHRWYFEGRTLRAPMNADQLARFGFFRRLGTFGLNPDEPASLDAMARYLHDYFHAERHPTLWINPQGRFADPREPVEVRPGVARVAASHDATRAVAVALEYAFWTDQKPELLIRVMPIEPARTNTPGWLRAIRDTMAENAARLAGLVIARDPANFEAILGGESTRVHPAYDLWMRLRGKAGAIDDGRDRAASADVLGSDDGPGSGDGITSSEAAGGPSTRPAVSGTG
ncbi:MAG: lysophospholipid acyltransferase family protein [Planctomycetota bacterium]